MPNGTIRLDDGWKFDQSHRMDSPPNVPLVVLTVPLPPAKKGKHMDFISSKRAVRYLWLKNISDNIIAEAVKMGQPAPAAISTKAVADSIIALMDATDTAQGAVDGARESEKTAGGAGIKELRGIIGNLKTLPGYAASGSEGVLGLKGPESSFDPNTFKPVLKVSIVGDAIKVEFTKGGVDMLAVYCRLRGTAAWRKLGTDSSSPYFDTEPLGNPNVPEVREYMAMGVIDDIEVGLPSDIVSVTRS